MSTKNQSDGRVINFKSGASVKITHPILCEFLDLGHQNPSNNRDKRLRAFTEEKVLPAHRESLQIDEEQFVVTIASLGDQALERMTHDFELDRALAGLLVWALLRCDVSSVSTLYWAGLTRLSDTVADLVMAYQGERRVSEILEPITKTGAAWIRIRDLLASNQPHQLFTNSLVPLCAQLFDFTTVPLCEEAWTYLLEPLLAAAKTLDPKKLDEEARHPDTMKIRLYRENNFGGDLTIIPMILKNILSSLMLSASSFLAQNLATVHSARYALESLAIMLHPDLPNFDKRVDIIFNTLPTFTDVIAAYIFKAITSDQLWKDAANVTEDIVRQSFHILLLMSMSCLHSVSQSASQSHTLLKTMEGQTESILAALTKAWARFSVKAQVRGFEKYTWARLRHAILDTHGTVTCDFRKKSYPILLIPFFSTIFLSMQVKLLTSGDVSPDALQAEATRLKDKGNSYFEKQSYLWAECFYTWGINLLGKAENKSPLGCILHSNRAQARLEMKQGQKALEDATLALSIQGDHTKSEDRRKQAQAMVNSNTPQATELQDSYGQHPVSLVPLEKFKFHQ